MQSTSLALLVVTAVALAGCDTGSAVLAEPDVTEAQDLRTPDAAPEAVGSADDPWEWVLPAGFPPPAVPADNPMTRQKVELGRHLFYDSRLSGNQTQSCASCHVWRRGFSDGLARAVGSTKQVHPRSAMPLANVAYFTALGWGNPVLSTLEKQAPLPMYGESPVELGLSGKDEIVLARLRAEPRYAALFAAAYPDQGDPFSMGNVVRAIACFERTLISGDSPFDRYFHGDDPHALSDSARRGMDLFFSEKLECFHCHGGFAFTDSVTFEGKAFGEQMFHNTGLYNVDGGGAFPAGNAGVYDVTGQPGDMGKMKAPSLRNIALTAPYMHDGTIATLGDVLDYYAAGGRVIEQGPHAGDGRANPFKSSFIKGFTLTPGEKEDVLSFLESLTDEAFLMNPRFGNPWLP